MTRFSAARRLALGVVLGVKSVSAQTTDSSSAETPDRFELSFRSETYVYLFRRALLPGPNGAVVATDTLLPLYQYVDFRADGVDSALGEDGLGLEASGWGRAYLAGSDDLGWLDG